MDKRIRVLVVFLIVCFGLLFLQLNNFQIRQSSQLTNSKYYSPPSAGDPGLQYRGEIISADGTVLAESKPLKGGGYQRYYPEGSLFENITGYDDIVNVNETGLEDEYDGYLIRHQSVPHTLDQVLTQQAGTDTVTITVSVKLQEVAAQSCAPYIQCSVVAIDPSTGAILALYGKPTFDPNKLAAHDRAAVEKYFQSLDPNSGSSALINAPVATTIAPGSTFKVITTASIFDHQPSLASLVFPVQSQISIPLTNQPLHNFGGESCGGNLAAILANSCDTAYAKLGLDLGAKNLYDEATAFGFNKVPPIDLPPGDRVAPSNFNPVSSFTGNTPFIAYSAIGQGDVTETVLQNALVAAAIGDNGTMMAPHLLDNVINDEGQVVTSYKPHRWLQATSAATADQVRSLMLGVVTHGTAANLGFPANLDVAAKTGTAETGTSNCSATWLIATAPAGPNDTPKIAVAANVPSQNGVGCSETGAEVAGPIVRNVVEAALGS